MSSKNGKKGSRPSKSRASVNSVSRAKENESSSIDVKKLYFTLPTPPPPPPPMCPYPYAGEIQGDGGKAAPVGVCNCYPKPAETEPEEEQLACCCDLLSPFAEEIREEQKKIIDKKIENPNEDFHCNAGDPHYHPRGSGFAHFYAWSKAERDRIKLKEERKIMLALRRKECAERQKKARLARGSTSVEDMENCACEPKHELCVVVQTHKPKPKPKKKSKLKKSDPAPKCQRNCGCEEKQKLLKNKQSGDQVDGKQGNKCNNAYFESVPNTVPKGKIKNQAEYVLCACDHCRSK